MPRNVVASVPTATMTVEVSHDPSSRQGERFEFRFQNKDVATQLDNAHTAAMNLLAVYYAEGSEAQLSTVAGLKRCAVLKRILGA